MIKTETVQMVSSLIAQKRELQVLSLDLYLVICIALSFILMQFCVSI